MAPAAYHETIHVYRAAVLQDALWGWLGLVVSTDGKRDSVLLPGKASDG
jgi:hypothetical protein